MSALKSLEAVCEVLEEILVKHPENLPPKLHEKAKLALVKAKFSLTGVMPPASSPEKP